VSDLVTDTDDKSQMHLNDFDILFNFLGFFVFVFVFSGELHFPVSFEMKLKGCCVYFYQVKLRYEPLCFTIC